MLTASFPSTRVCVLAVMATSLGTLSNGERVGIGSVCVCMHVCMHVCVCACKCMCVCVCVYVHSLCVGPCFTLCVFHVLHSLVFVCCVGSV